MSNGVLSSNVQVNFIVMEDSQAGSNPRPHCANSLDHINCSYSPHSLPTCDGGPGYPSFVHSEWIRLFCSPGGVLLANISKISSLVRWTFLGYTAITILLYFVWVAMSGEWTIPWGPIAKIVEAAMIVILLREPYD